MTVTSLEFPSDFPFRFVGRKEAAHILGISERSFDRLVGNEPTFPTARRLGRHRKWFLRELLDWMEQRPL